MSLVLCTIVQGPMQGLYSEFNLSGGREFHGADRCMQERGPVMIAGARLSIVGWGFLLCPDIQDMPHDPRS